jgi:hypothetical protein
VRPDGIDGFEEVGGSIIKDIISIDGCNDGMLEA